MRTLVAAGPPPICMFTICFLICFSCLEVARDLVQTTLVEVVPDSVDELWQSEHVYLGRFTEQRLH